MIKRLRPALLCSILAAGLRLAAQSATGGSGPPPAVPAGTGAPRPPTDGTGAISGVVSDGATHRPIAGAVVYLGIQGRGPVGRMSRQVTDPKGRFVFVDLPAADAFFMNVSKAGYNDGHYGDGGPVSLGVGAGLIRLVDGQWFSQANIPLWRPGVIAGAVVDERGEPVVGVRVRSLARIMVAGLPHYAAGAAATTDDRGRYRLPGLPPGIYVVNVPSVQSTVPASLTPLEIEGLTADAASRRSSDTPSRNNGAVDLDGRHLLIIGNYPTPPTTPAARQVYPMAFAPGGSSPAEAGFELRNGESRDGVDIVLRPVTTVRVSGRLDAPSENVRGLVLRLVAAGLDDLGEGSEAATAIAEADGSFTFLNVPPGSYTLDATHSMFEYSYGPSRAMSDQEMPGTPGAMPGPGTFLGGIPSGPPSTRMSGSHTAGDLGLWARVPLNVGGADVTGVIVPMHRAVTMRGRFAFDGTGDPPGRTVVVAEPADGRASLGLQSSSRQAAPGEEDRFEIAGLLPGEFVLRIVGLTPRQAVLSVTAGGGTDYTTKPFDTSGGQDINDVVITYTDRIASIAGAVQADAGAPLLSVIAFPAAREQWSKYGLTPSRFKNVPVTNSATYKIDNIPAGAYYLVAVDAQQSRRWQDPVFLDAAARAGVRVTVGWGETKAQDLRVSVIK